MALAQDADPTSRSPEPVTHEHIPSYPERVEYYDAPEAVPSPPSPVAPKHKYNTSAPEVDPTSGPEHDPEAQKRAVVFPGSGRQDTEKHVASQDSSSRRHISRRTIIAVCAIIVLLALGLGLGLGLGLNSSRLHGQSSNNEPPPSSNATNSLPEYIVKNSSLATIIQSDGGRRVFFQAPDGAIRQAVYSIATNNWISPTTIVNGTNILKNTPISASSIYNTTSVNGAPNVDGIYLFYLDNDHNLQLQVASEGVFKSIDTGISTDKSLRPSASSTTFSAIAMNGLNANYNDIYIRLQMGNDGKMTILRGRHSNLYPSSSPKSLPTELTTKLDGVLKTNTTLPSQRFTWLWYDVTSVLENKIKPLVKPAQLSWLNLPGTMWKDEFVNSTGFIELTLYNYDKEKKPFWGVFYLWFNNSTDLEVALDSQSDADTTASTSKNPSFAPNALTECFGEVFVDPTTSKLSILNDSGLPTLFTDINDEIKGIPSNFTYPNLGCTSPARSNLVYMYHQADGQTILEETWDTENKQIFQKNVTISS